MPLGFWRQVLLQVTASLRVGVNDQPQTAQFHLFMPHPATRAGAGVEHAAAAIVRQEALRRRPQSRTRSSVRPPRSCARRRSGQGQDGELMVLEL